MSKTADADAAHGERELAKPVVVYRPGPSRKAQRRLGGYVQRPVRSDYTQSENCAPGDDDVP